MVDRVDRFSSQEPKKEDSELTAKISELFLNNPTQEFTMHEIFEHSGSKDILEVASVVWYDLMEDEDAEKDGLIEFTLSRNFKLKEGLRLQEDSGS